MAMYQTQMRALVCGKQLLVLIFDLQRQKIFISGQIYVSLNRVTNLQSISLTGSFKQDFIKLNKKASQEYDRLCNEAVFVLPIEQNLLPTTLSVIFFNNRSLKKHAADIASDSEFINNDIPFLTEIS